MVADIANPSAPERVVADVRSQLGDPAVLVNAAGIFGPLAPLVQTDPDEWARTFAVNVVAPYRFARAVLRPMLANGFGRIVNISSLAATGPACTLNSAYSATKVALNRWTAVLARELEGTGVTANALHPGDLRTRMWEEIDAAASRADAADFRACADRVSDAGDDPDAAARRIVAIVHDSDAQTGIFSVGADGSTPQDAQGLTWAPAAD
jgi:NAD(P)-dependent dehydrogenase (short-subunit alcohol dehydrogenase family)